MGDDNEFFKDLAIFVGELTAIIVPLVGIWSWNIPFKLEVDVITRLIATIGYLFIIILFYIKYNNNKLSKEIKKLEAIEKEREVDRN